jgi:hypothetical protein
MEASTTTPESAKTLQDKIQELGSLVREDGTGLDYEELPNLDKLIDDWYDEEVDVTKEDFHRRILEVFRDSKHTEVYEGVMAQFPDDTRGILQSFIDGEKDAEEAGKALAETTTESLDAPQAPNVSFEMMATSVKATVGKMRLSTRSTCLTL